MTELLSSQNKKKIKVFTHDKKFEVDATSAQPTPVKDTFSSKNEFITDCNISFTF